MNQDSQFRWVVAGSVLLAGCIGATDGAPVDEEIGQVVAAVTCEPRMTIFPVGSEHNIGYDNASCGTGTCAISCPDRNANSDWMSTDHQGIDIFAFRGAPLVAVADGTVVRVGTPSSTSGLRVRLRDDCGWEYYYGHLDSVSVSQGQRVSAGDLLGTMGNSGTGGVHLHFNISPDGDYSNDINPFPLLEATSGTACAPAPPPPPPPPPAEPPTSARNDASPRPTLTSVGAPSRFAFAGPTRVFDTRTGMGSARLVRSDGSSDRLSGEVSGTVSDWPSVPAGATGVWLNLAALGSITPGFIVAHPDGPAPETSTLNFFDGQVRANAVAIPLASSPAATFATTSEVDIIADLLGVFADDGLGLVSVPPARVGDSRPGPVPAATEHRVNVMAPAEAVGVVATVTALSTGTPGFITAYPCGSPRPETSNINYGDEGARANTVISAIAGGELCFWSSSEVQIIVDVTGYLVPAGLSYQALSPTRILDTRDDTSLYVGRLAAGQVVEIPLQSLAGAPAELQAAFVNITAVGTTGAGFFTAFPCGAPRPETSSLNYRDADVVGVMALSQISDGNLCIYSLQRTHLVVDLLGTWVPMPPAPPLADAGPSSRDAGVSGDSGSPVDASTGSADAGAGVDASTDPPGVEGGCSLGSHSRGGAPFGLAVFIALFAARRRR